jgi:glycosyltransferase involved in cell wall biosynthesis
MCVSAYVPCYNQRSTVGNAVRSIRDQTIPVAEVFVVDDGSTDGLPDSIEGARVVRLGTNRGRGHARARAIVEARDDLVLCCDASNILAPDFVAKARPWFDDAGVAGVFGRIRPGPDRTLPARWRARHLFKSDVEFPLTRKAQLGTWGCMLRRSAVLAVGNFNEHLRHSEDAELGARLLGAGYDVVGDPALWAESRAVNTIPEVLERYWRWHAGIGEPASWRSYFKVMVYAARVMARDDLRAGDLAAAAVSLVCPHYQFWKSRARHRAGFDARG